MNKRTLLTKSLVLLACTIFLLSCSSDYKLPSLVNVDTSKMLNVVRTQLDSARQAVDTTPEDASAVGEYGLVLTTYGLDEAADVAFTRARKLAPEKSIWTFYHAFVLRRLGKSDETMQAIEAGLSAQPEQIDLLVKKAQHLFESAHYEEAALILEAVLARNPDYPLALFYTGKIHSQKQQWDSAIDVYEHMLSRGILATEVHFQLATAFRAKGDLLRAAEQQQLTDARSQRRITGYDPVIMQLSKLNLGDAPHVARAGALYNAGKTQLAIDQLEEALRKNPENAGAHTHLVRMYGHQGKLKEARYNFERALELGEALPQLYSNMGFAYRISNQHTQAAEAYLQATAQDPYNANNYAELAYALVKTGNHANAIKEFQKSLDIQPNNRHLRYVYGTTLTLLNRLPEAVEMLNSALEPADQKGAVVLRSLAQAHALAGNKKTSLVNLQTALKIAKSFQNETMVKDLQADIEQLGLPPVNGS